MNIEQRISEVYKCLDLYDSMDMFGDVSQQLYLAECPFTIKLFETMCFMLEIGKFPKQAFGESFFKLKELDSSVDVAFENFKVYRPAKYVCLENLFRSSRYTYAIESFSYACDLLLNLFGCTLEEFIEEGFVLSEDAVVAISNKYFSYYYEAEEMDAMITDWFDVARCLAFILLEKDVPAEYLQKQNYLSTYDYIITILRNIWLKDFPGIGWKSFLFLAPEILQCYYRDYDEASIYGESADAELCIFVSENYFRLHQYKDELPSGMWELIEYVVEAPLVLYPYRKEINEENGVLFVLCDSYYASAYLQQAMILADKLISLLLEKIEKKQAE